MRFGRYHCGVRPWPGGAALFRAKTERIRFVSLKFCGVKTISRSMTINES